MSGEGKVITLSFSLVGIGIAVGIVLCVLQGVDVIDVGWFWATFPFWIVPAAELAIGIAMIASAVIAGLITIKSKEK